MEEHEIVITQNVSDEFGMKKIFYSIFKKVESRLLQEDLMKYKVEASDDFVYSGGWINRSTRKIYLRRDYHREHPDEVELTLAHEMAHAVVFEIIGWHNHNNSTFKE